MFENPCTSFSDHNSMGGTRTWAHPEGDKTNAKEVTGNHLSKITVACILKLHAWGKGWIFENQEHRGVYPKVYDLPWFLEMLQTTKAVIIPGAMCAWGLQPLDASSDHHFYRKGYWLVVSANLAPFFTGLRKPCPGLSPTHCHVELRGNVAGKGIKRTREAAQYPPSSRVRSRRQFGRPQRAHPPNPSGGAEPLEAVTSEELMGRKRAGRRLKGAPGRGKEPCRRKRPPGYPPKERPDARGKENQRTPTRPRRAGRARCAHTARTTPSTRRRS